MVKKKQRKRSDYKKLKDKAWSVYSAYIRQKHANIDGMARCVTCVDEMKAWKPWKELQAGHFIPTRSGNVLFAEHNVHPQCYACNIHKNGAWVEYYKFMLGTYGIEVINKLMDLKYAPPKSTADFKDECERIISLYGHYKK